MNLRPSKSLLAWLCMAAAGCAGSAAMSSRYPTAQYIVAQGESPLSYEQAAAHARAEVAAQVRSSLRAVVQSSMTSTTRDGVTQDTQRLESTSQLTTTFEHAERIHIDAASRRRVKNLYTVTAYLSRAEAASEHLSAHASAASEFQRAARLLQSPQATDRDWAASFQHAQDAFARLTTEATAIRVITRGTPAGLDQDVARMAALAQERMARVAAARVRVIVAPDASPLLNVALQEALASLGVTRTIADDAAYELRIAAVRDARVGPVGPVCRIVLQGSWRDARTGAELGVIKLDSPEFVGADVRDAARAESRAWQRVSATALRALLQPQLAALLPLAAR